MREKDLLILRAGKRGDRFFICVCHTRASEQNGLQYGQQNECDKEGYINGQRCDKFKPIQDTSYGIYDCLCDLIHKYRECIFLHQGNPRENRPDEHQQLQRSDKQICHVCYEVGNLIQCDLCL